MMTSVALVKFRPVNVTAVPAVPALGLMLVTSGSSNGNATTVNLNDCCEVRPFWSVAVMVIGYVPTLPSAGTPESTADAPSLAFRKVTPRGNSPDQENDTLEGSAATDTTKLSWVASVKDTCEALANAGGLGGTLVLALAAGTNIVAGGTNRAMHKIAIATTAETRLRGRPKRGQVIFGPLDLAIIMVDSVAPTVVSVVVVAKLTLSSSTGLGWAPASSPEVMESATKAVRPGVASVMTGWGVVMAPELSAPLGSADSIASS